MSLGLVTLCHLSFTLTWGGSGWDIQSARLRGHSGCRKAGKADSSWYLTPSQHAQGCHRVEWRPCCPVVCVESQFFSLSLKILSLSTSLDLVFSHLSRGVHRPPWSDLCLPHWPWEVLLSPCSLHILTSWVLFQDATFSLTSGPLHVLFFLPGRLFPCCWPGDVLPFRH